MFNLNYFKEKIEAIHIIVRDSKEKALLQSSAKQVTETSEVHSSRWNTQKGGHPCRKKHQAEPGKSFAVER